MANVYSISKTGDLVLESRYSTISKPVQWWSDPQLPDYITVLPTGPRRYEDIGAMLTALSLDDTKPFLIVKFAAPVTIESMVLKKLSFFTSDWSAHGLKISIVDSKRNNKSEYIPCGDYIQYMRMNGSFLQSFLNDSNRDNNSYLFAHQSIVRTFPEEVVHSELRYASISTTEPADDPGLYHPLGFFHQNPDMWLEFTNPGLYIKTYPSLPAVLRACLFWQLNAVHNNDFITTASFTRKNGVQSYANTFKSVINPSHGLILGSAELIVEKMLDSILKKVKDHSIAFQGLYDYGKGALFEEKAKRFMIGLCKSDYGDIPKYPNVCACIGRKGVEEKLRIDMGNDLVRMVCQSAVCLNGDTTGDVFTYTPSPPCAPINICKPGLDVNSAKVTMSNVTFNCNFDKDTPPAPTVQTITPPLSSSTPGSSPAKAPMSKKTKIAIGASAGVGLLLLIIIVAVIAKKRVALKKFN